MRCFVNILALLIFGTTIVVLSNTNEQQSKPTSFTQHIEVEFSQSYPTSIFNIITSRQSSTTPTARRIHSDNRHNKTGNYSLSINSSVWHVVINFCYNYIQQNSLSLVFRLRNIRI